MSLSILLVVSLYLGQPVITASFVDSETCMKKARVIVRVLNNTEGFSNAEAFCKPTDQRAI